MWKVENGDVIFPEKNYSIIEHHSVHIFQIYLLRSMFYVHTVYTAAGDDNDAHAILVHVTWHTFSLLLVFSKYLQLMGFHYFC